MLIKSPEKVWQALTDPALSRQYFFGFAVDVEPKAGGAFFLRYPDGRVHVSGKVAAWEPPRRFACTCLHLPALACTWLVEGMKDFDQLPECLVTYDIEQAGDSVRLTMTEAHTWDVPEAILSGGRAGWPAILSSLKSLLETGRSLSVKMRPPPEMLEAVRALKR